MPLTKQQILDLIDLNCTQQGKQELSAPVLKELVENYVAEQGTAVADIATPATATAEDVANKINELLGVLRTAGVIAT